MLKNVAHIKETNSNDWRFKFVSFPPPISNLSQKNKTKNNTLFFKPQKNIFINTSNMSTCPNCLRKYKSLSRHFYQSSCISIKSKRVVQKKMSITKYSLLRNKPSYITHTKVCLPTKEDNQSSTDYQFFSNTGNLSEEDQAEFNNYYNFQKKLRRQVQQILTKIIIMI